VSRHRAESHPHGELVERSLMLVTALAPHIGYEKAAAIAHRRTTRNVAARRRRSR